jgi:hypothetical protein
MTSEQETLERQTAASLTARYRAINNTIDRIRRDQVQLAKQTKEFVQIFESVRDRNKTKIGWWLSKFGKGMDYKFIKSLVSFSNRTKDPEQPLQSWQLRLFGLLVTVHHRDRKQVEKKRTSRKKDKSFMFFLGKGHSLLVKQIEQMGGIESLDEEQREAILQQFGPTADVLRKLQR